MSTGADRAVDSNARTNRYIRILATIAAVILIALGVASNLSAATQRRTILGCTTAGPHTPTAADPTTGHRCYDEGTKRTAAAVANLQKSIDCVALYAIHQHPPGCAAVDARMDSLAAGGDPFAAVPPTSSPPTTTTTTAVPTKESNP